MKVTMEVEYRPKQGDYRITKRIVISDHEALTCQLEDAVELLVLLHARCNAKLDEAMAKERDRTARRLKPIRRQVLEAMDTELPPELRDALLDMVKSARDVKPLPTVEAVRTEVRAALVLKYQSLGQFSLGARKP